MIELVGARPPLALVPAAVMQPEEVQLIAAHAQHGVASAGVHAGRAPVGTERTRIRQPALAGCRRSDRHGTILADLQAADHGRRHDLHLTVAAPGAKRPVLIDQRAIAMQRDRLRAQAQQHLARRGVRQVHFQGHHALLHCRLDMLPGGAAVGDHLVRYDVRHPAAQELATSRCRHQFDHRPIRFGQQRQRLGERLGRLQAEAPSNGRLRNAGRSRV